MILNHFPRPASHKRLSKHGPPGTCDSGSDRSRRLPPATPSRPRRPPDAPPGSGVGPMIVAGIPSARSREEECDHARQTRGKRRTGRLEVLHGGLLRRDARLSAASTQLNTRPNSGQAAGRGRSMSSPRRCATAALTIAEAGAGDAVPRAHFTPAGPPACARCSSRIGGRTTRYTVLATVADDLTAYPRGGIVGHRRHATHVREDDVLAIGELIDCVGVGAPPSRDDHTVRGRSRRSRGRDCVAPTFKTNSADAAIGHAERDGGSPWCSPKLRAHPEGMTATNRPLPSNTSLPPIACPWTVSPCLG